MQNSVEINWSSSKDYPNDHEVSYSLYCAETTSMEIEGTESWVQITSKLKTNFYEWDTSGLDHGWYHIKVVSECEKGMKVSDTTDSAFSIGIDRARNQMIGEYGGIIPGITILISITVDYPRIIELVKNKTLVVEPLVTGKYPLSEINEAFDIMRRGEGIRTVILCQR